MAQATPSLNASLEDRLTTRLIHVALSPRLYEDCVKVVTLHPIRSFMARSMEGMCSKGMTNLHVKTTLAFRLAHAT